MSLGELTSLQVEAGKAGEAFHLLPRVFSLHHHAQELRGEEVWRGRGGHH